MTKTKSEANGFKTSKILSEYGEIEYDANSGFLSIRDPDPVIESK